jgi:hypothetical protein
VWLTRINENLKILVRKIDNRLDTLVDSTDRLSTGCLSSIDNNVETLVRHTEVLDTKLLDQINNKPDTLYDALGQQIELLAEINDEVKTLVRQKQTRSR